jgi:hypothetical protein
MKDDLPCLLNRRDLCRARTAVHLCERENRLRRATPRLRYRSKIADALEFLIHNGIFESGRIGRRLRLSENRLAQLATQAARVE